VSLCHVDQSDRAYCGGLGPRRFGATRCEAATNPKLKEDWLDLELHWVRIAEDYRFVERMERFLDHAQQLKEARTKSVPPKS
jgi:hypothetical protein